MSEFPPKCRCLEDTFKLVTSLTGMAEDAVLEDWKILKDELRRFEKDLQSLIDDGCIVDDTSVKLAKESIDKMREALTSKDTLHFSYGAKKLQMAILRNGMYLANCTVF